MNGITRKERDVVGTISSTKADIILLTEVHRNHEALQKWLENKNYTVLMNETTGNAWNGTAIIIKNNTLQGQNPNYEQISPGRISKIKIDINNHTHHIYCVYFTSGTDPQERTERITQTNKLKENITRTTHGNDKVIIGGDFNLIETNLDTGKPQNFRNHRDAVHFTATQQELHFVDIFRTLNPDKREYTRIEGDSATRLDRFYTSENIDPNSANTPLSPPRTRTTNLPQCSQ